MTDDAIYREFSRLALEQATLSIAAMARSFALQFEGGLLPMMSAPDALRALATAIENTNQKVWGAQDGTKVN